MIFGANVRTRVSVASTIESSLRGIVSVAVVSLAGIVIEPVVDAEKSTSGVAVPESTYSTVVALALGSDSIS